MYTDNHKNMSYWYDIQGAVIMKVAVIGSRNLMVEDLGKYPPEETTEIVSGRAKGIATCAVHSKK